MHADDNSNKNYFTVDLKLNAECKGEAKVTKTKIAVPAKTPFGFILDAYYSKIRKKKITIPTIQSP